MTPNHRPHSRKAFTLVELLVVIGIIALLISILLPALGKARKSARTVQCGSNLRQIGVAMQVYTSANKGFLPPGFAQDANGNVYNWTSLLVTTMDKNGGGPTNSAGDLASGTGTTGGFRRIFQCPEVSGFNEFDRNDVAVTHYLAHPRLMPNIAGAGFPDRYLRDFGGQPTALLRGYNIARLKRGVEIVMAFDGSMSLLQGFGQNTNYSGAPYFRPRQGIPIAELMDDAALAFARTSLISDWANTSKRPETPVNMTARDASGAATTNAKVNTDQDGNDRNFRFRHGNNDVLNALFGDGHVATFATSKKNLTATPPNGGELKCRNIHLDRP